MTQTETTQLQCACGAVTLELSGAPILTAECCCNSCREAGATLEQLPGPAAFRGPVGQIPYVMYRKDRVRFPAGTELLREYRLTPEAHTRRVVAGCCNTPMFLEFQGGHWLSLFAGLWPDSARPPMQMRTMTSDLPDASVLPADLPNAKTQSPGFMAKLLWAWVAMGFRTPKVEVQERLEV